VTTLLEDVINRGTGASVRALGFAAPAAGKTGTSRDGWFAGYTSNLLCVVWIGFDDNRDLGLQGGQSAAPVWAEFMKRAITLPAYRNVQDFTPPEGVTEEMIDPQSGGLATTACPQKEAVYFITGSEPTQYCELHGGNPQSAHAPGTSWLSHLFGKDTPPANAAPQPVPNAPGGTPNPANIPRGNGGVVPRPGQPENPPPAPAPEKKKGLLDKIFGIFGSSKKPADEPKPQP